MIRVLVVTKHAQVREGLCMVLRLARGIEVTGAVAGQSAAVEQARADQPHAALVDLEMPGGEGYETIRQLRRLCPTTRVIALTAHDYPAARAGALQAGARQVILKGMELEELVAAIQAAVAEP